MIPRPAPNRAPGWFFWLVFWAACFALGCLIAYGGISAH